MCGQAAAYGFATATIELPGDGDRPGWPAAEQARADLRQAMQAGELASDEIVDALILPLVEKAVPEWRAALDALLTLPEIGGPIGYSGGLSPSASGWRRSSRASRLPDCSPGVSWLTPCSRRLGGSPLRCMSLLQWDDGGNDQQAALDLFDAFGSKEKTLHANMGGHTGIPHFARDATAQFFTRHLK